MKLTVLQSIIEGIFLLRHVPKLTVTFFWEGILVFDVHLTVHRDKFLIIKQTRWTNFSNIFLDWNSTFFGQYLCASSGVFQCTCGNGICHTCLLTACEQDQDETAVPSWSRSQAASKPLWHTPLLCVLWKTPDDGQRNCPKHVEFQSKNIFQKLVHVVGFIIKNISWFAYVIVHFHYCNCSDLRSFIYSRFYTTLMTFTLHNTTAVKYCRMINGCSPIPSGNCNCHNL